MRKNKTGTIFLVSILALAGIGISYAGFTDVITVFGTVDTATVEIAVVDYSGTDVWKVYGPGAPPGEIVEWHGFVNDPARPTQASLELLYPGCTVILVASSWALAGIDYDVDMVWDNIFPCIDFTADVIIHYIGSIPAKVGVGDLVWDVNGFDFSPYVTFAAYWYMDINPDPAIVELQKGQAVELPVQMHYCDYIGIEVTIHLEQDDELQDLTGTMSFDIMAMQWNEQLPYQFYPTKNIGSGSLTIIGVQSDWAWLNPIGYNFGTNPYSFDLTAPACNEGVALMGFVDTSEGELGEQGEWSPYYASFVIRDNSGKYVQAGFSNTWLGAWYELPAQNWDRVRLENNMGLPQPERHHVNVGGNCGYLIDGTWVGYPNGDLIYGSTERYFFQLIADPIAETFTLQVYAMGSSAPDTIPFQNMYNYPQWNEIGSITVGASNFNFEAVQFEARLDPSGDGYTDPDDTTTISWYDLHIGIPLSFSEIP
ncbi:MAG: hypothetical protein WC525_02345 [Candidatus Thermoplasmatota archaeon]